MSEPLRIGVVGLGYWGPNLARNFDALPDVELAWLSDDSPEQIERQLQRFPSARAGSFEELLADPRARRDRARHACADARADLRCAVLEAGKHCFVEKPLAQSAADAEAVAEVARRSGRTLMVGHLLEYHPGLEALKKLVDDGELGTVHYIYGNRLNLGKLRPEENALWSLGAHDVSVVLRLAGEEPVECHAHGECYMQDGVEDVVFCYLRFPSGLAAHLHLSWLDPHKERRFTVVGSKKMATFDDMALEQKLKVYDKGFDQPYEGYGEYIARSGDVHSPQRLERGAAADRVPPLRRVPPRGTDAALGRRGGRARGAGARGAAAEPGRGLGAERAGPFRKVCGRAIGRGSAVRRQSAGPRRGPPARIWSARPAACAGERTRRPAGDRDRAGAAADGGRAGRIRARGLAGRLPARVSQQRGELGGAGDGGRLDRDERGRMFSAAAALYASSGSSPA